MKHILLLGAGFSRNWGGWLVNEAFEYLLGCSQVRDDSHLRKVLWASQANGGYESALSELRKEFLSNPAKSTKHLESLEHALVQMFGAMNEGFRNFRSIEIDNKGEPTFMNFLSKFDAIFTLNQDLLLEQHYVEQNLSNISKGKWGRVELPGIVQTIVSGATFPPRLSVRMYVPTTEPGFKETPRVQPYYKLHGSSNWETHERGSILIMGGNKTEEIDRFPLLKWYQSQFRDYLSERDSRLMVIGYGFKDSHINRAIGLAANYSNLHVFIIDPRGSDLIREIPADHITPDACGLGRDAIFERALIGASRRSLHEIFGMDSVECSKVMSFFN